MFSVFVYSLLIEVLNSNEVLLIFLYAMFGFCLQSHGDILTFMSMIHVKIIFLKLISFFPYGFPVNLALYIKSISNPLNCKRKEI